MKFQYQLNRSALHTFIYLQFSIISIKNKKYKLKSGKEEKLYVGSGMGILVEGVDSLGIREFGLIIQLVFFKISLSASGYYL